jgi:hypothetical protein
MKRSFLLLLVAAMNLFSLSAYSQAKEDTTALLGLPGDNLDLYAVLDLFQKSKTIEGFEKSLNDEKTKINNLDLNLDKKIDFIKVVTKKDGDSYTFILQVDVSKKETQDVAVILLDKGKDKKISLQIVGDEDLYGKDYVIEPKEIHPLPRTLDTLVLIQSPKMYRRQLLWWSNRRQLFNTYILQPTFLMLHPIIMDIIHHGLGLQR